MIINSRFLIYSFLISVKWSILLYISVFISDANLKVFFILFIVASVFIADAADKLIETKQKKRDKTNYLNQNITLKLVAVISLKLVIMILVAWMAIYYSDELIELFSVKIILPLLHTGIGAFWMFQIQRAWTIRNLY